MPSESPDDPHKFPPLTEQDHALYEWQMGIPDFGEAGQRRLKGASVLISRCGGVGGAVAYALAAAGVGRLVIAHAGNVRPSDLNRQILMTHDWLGKPRVECAARRLRELNPGLSVEGVPQNITSENVQSLVQQVDLVVSAAPLFEERLLLNRQAVLQNRPMVDCAMYELQAQVTVVRPRRSACLACLSPQLPPAWKRQFPVFGAVAAMIGSLGAMEAIKALARFGEPLFGQMLLFDLRDGNVRRLKLTRNPACQVCGGPA